MRLPIRTPAPIRVVFGGQSHNSWPPAELPPGTPWVDGIGPYPNRLMRYFAGIPWANTAHGGHGWAELAQTFDVDVRPQARNRPGCIDIFIMSGGQGDIYNDDCTGAETYQRAVAYAQEARDIGFHYVLATTMPAFGPGGSIDPTPDMLQARVDHNTLLMADAEGQFDAIADWHSDPILADATNQTWWESDRAHFKPPTADLAASIMEPILRELVNQL